MAAAIAARTSSIGIVISAIVSPLHDPVRIAEDAAVVDLISGGRLNLVLVNGYVADEFAMFGVDMATRARRTTSSVKLLRAAWSGELVEHEGRQIRVTPAPERPTGGPPLTLGGSTKKAAERAARIADGFSPSMPEVWDFYRAERIALGNADPGPHPGSAIADFYLAEDVERGWDEVGQYFLHETNAYGKWMTDAGLPGMYDPSKDVDDLRAKGMYRVLTPDLLLAEIEAAGPFAFVLFHPLLGGIPPELGWRGLRLFEHDVLPNVVG
jgi:alkanesulfonate monooxygenase SsuD/methylene tetrahydromethanopterin reductase-like flavin-dependent oxidoreductase (luciferase family)